MVWIFRGIQEVSFYAGYFSFSALWRPSVKTKALEAGADDYVVKPFSVEELTARVKAVLRRVGSQTDSTVTQDPHQWSF